MRKLPLWLLSLLFSQLFSQTNTPLVISSGGNYIVNGDYSQAITIGELAIETLHSNDYYLMQGFQQPLSNPEIESNDTDKRVCLNDSTAFTVSASGGGTLNFQWKKNGVEVPGETDSIIIFNPSVFADSGLYYCEITNTIGTISSPELRLIVDTIPSVSLNIGEFFCENELAYDLTGGTPVGGTYTIYGNVVSEFLPSDYTLGMHEIFYAFTDGNGCFAAAKQEVIINSITEASLIDPGDLCINSDALILTGGMPAEGIYMLDSNEVTEVSPSIIGLGEFDLSYIYVNANGCSDTAYSSITVNDTTEIAFGEMAGVCYGHPFFALTTGLPQGGIYSGVGVVGESEFFSEEAGTGTHTLRYTFENGFNCTSRTEQTIEVFVPPSISLGDDQIICPDGTAIFEIDAGYVKYNWSTGESTQSISVNAEGDYSVRVTDNNNCVSTDTATVTHSLPWNDPEVCLVTVSEQGKNLIVWEPQSNLGVASYIIYKQRFSVGNFEPIGSVAFGDDPWFIDQDSEPRSHSDFYKVAIEDTCGNVSMKSPYHKTIHLSVTKDQQNNGINLEWDEVEIEGQTYAFPTYFIYRGENYASLNEIYALPSNSRSYTDMTAPADKKSVYVVTVKKLDACVVDYDKKATSIFDFSESVSNIDTVNNTVGINYLIDFTEGLSIYPNPANESVTLKFDNPDNDEFDLFLTDASGKLVYQEEGITSEEVILERKELVGGVYFVSLIGKKLMKGKIIFNNFGEGL